jgi:S1-C subfamily serine protease
MRKFIVNGCDSNSIAGDAEFVNPGLGDYGLKKDSKAKLIGFVPFDMNTFGVQKVSLKVIAKTPVFPEVNTVANADQLINGRIYSLWAGAKLWSPLGEEFSAFGISFSSTGIALDGIEEQSIGYSMGFRSGDLIQSVNKVGITNADDFKGYLMKYKNTSEHRFEVIRNQKKIQLVVSNVIPEMRD